MEGRALCYLVPCQTPRRGIRPG